MYATALLVCTSVGAARGEGVQTRSPRPIPLGVSGGSIDDWSTRGTLTLCCGGTLGALVQDPGGTLYILSNNHVLGLANGGTIGDDIVQPGIIDSCPDVLRGNAVADLSSFIPISWDGDNLVDAAIAQIRPGQVDTSGVIHDIGTPGPDTLIAHPGLAVKKSGRSTGLTHGMITAVDVSVTVGYNRSCAGEQASFARFVNQILVEPGTFSEGGDSGSLIVEAVPDDPRAVGLLFAGSDLDAIANPIDAVLAAFGVSMPGGAVEHCGNGNCDAAEDQCNCPADCGPPPAGETNCSDGLDNDCDSSTDCADGDCRHGPVCACGNGVCDMGLGEDCRNCPEDCNHETSGEPPGRYCCGDDVDCSDPRCTVNGNTCTTGVNAFALDRPGRAHLIRAAISRVSEVKSFNSDLLFAIPDVVGHGIGTAEDGTVVIEVYLSRENLVSRGRLHAVLAETPMRVKVKGSYLAH